MENRSGSIVLLECLCSSYDGSLLGWEAAFLNELPLSANRSSFKPVLPIWFFCIAVLVMFPGLKLFAFFKLFFEILKLVVLILIVAFFSLAV